METMILVARVGLSLAAVLGLLWWFSRRMQASTTLRRRRREALVVLGRQQLGGKTGVALIEASGRRLVIGYGEHGVSLLHDAGEVEEAEEAPAAKRSAAIPAIDTAVVADATDQIVDADEALAPVAASAHAPAAARPKVAAPVHIRSNSARTAEARRPRTPLEGSILAPDTWRKAVVAAQEWTTRRS